MKGSPERKNEILNCAKDEFLRKGYEQASLREICAKADVTTGALYFYFKNKAELFDMLVRDVAIKTQSLIEKQLTEEGRSRTSQFGIDEDLIRFMLDNREELLLLCTKSKGTKYEGYMLRVEETVADSLHRVMENACGKTVDKEVARIIAKSRVACYGTIISKEYTLEQALELSNHLLVYGRAGLASLLDSLRNE